MFEHPVLPEEHIKPCVLAVGFRDLYVATYEVGVCWTPSLAFFSIFSQDRHKPALMIPSENVCLKAVLKGPLGPPLGDSFRLNDSIYHFDAFTDTSYDS